MAGENYLQELSLTEFIEKLGSSAPTPGGGGGAALSGACAAALVTMVARLTKGKEAFLAQEPRMDEIISEIDATRAELLACIAGDAGAYQAVVGAYKLPKTTPEEKAVRSARIQEALVIATESPLGIARRCARVAEIAAELASTGNPHTVSDAGTAAVLAEAALQGALMQARINLGSIKDTAYVEKARSEIENLVERTLNARAQAESLIKTKLG